MAPIYLEKNREVVKGLENLNRATREGDWELFRQADNGRWYFFENKSEGGGRVVRMYLLDKNEIPNNNNLALISSEHYLVHFTKDGKLSHVTEVDVVGMKRHNITGYQSKYMRRIDYMNSDQLTNASYTLGEMKKYLAAHGTSTSSAS